MSSKSRLAPAETRLFVLIAVSFWIVAPALAGMNVDEEGLDAYVGAEPSGGDSDGHGGSSDTDEEQRKWNRWRLDLLSGIEFSQDRGTFSEQSAIIQVFGDIRWSKQRRLHSYIKFGLSSIPIEEVDPSLLSRLWPAPGPPPPDMPDNEDGLDRGAGSIDDPPDDGLDRGAGSIEDPSNDSLDRGAGSKGMLASHAQKDLFDSFLASRQSLTTEGAVYIVKTLEATLNLGVGFKAGLSLIDEDALEKATAGLVTRDNVSYYYGPFFRIAAHTTGADDGGRNPPLLWRADLGLIYSEDFLDESELQALGARETDSHRFPRVTFDAMARPPGLGFMHAGLKSNLGRGPDDVRFYVAFNLDLKKLVGLEGK